MKDKKKEKKEFRVSTTFKFENDKYYTPDETIKECMEILRETIDIDEVDVVIEPSAGSGAFIPYIEKMFPNAEKIYLDLIPEKEGIKEQDYLKFSYNNNGKIVLTVGNPPYGGDGRSLYRKFYERSCLFSEYIAFILPSNVILYPEYLYEFNLLRTHHLGRVEYYNLNGKSKPVNTAFLIYRRPNNPLGTLNRRKDVLKEYRDFKVVRHKRTETDQTFSQEYIDYIKSLGAGIASWGNPLRRVEIDEFNCRSEIIYLETDREDIKEYFQNFDWNSYYRDNYLKYNNSAPHLSNKIIHEVLEKRFDDLK